MVTIGFLAAFLIDKSGRDQHWKDFVMNCISCACKKTIFRCNSHFHFNPTFISKRTETNYLIYSLALAHQIISLQLVDS